MNNQIESKFVVNTRDLHKELGIQTEYSHWINRFIDEYKLEENIDFRLVKKDQSNTEVSVKNDENSKGGRPLKDYYTTLAIKDLIISKHNKKADKLITEFASNFKEAMSNPRLMAEMFLKYADIIESKQEQITTLEIKNKDLKHNLESNHLKITTPTEVGKMFTPKLSAIKMNKLAEYLGYIELVSRKSTKDPKKLKYEWKITEKALGAKHMDVYIHTEIGSKKFSKAQIGWTDEGIEYLKRNIARLIADLDNEEIY